MNIYMTSLCYLGISFSASSVSWFPQPNCFRVDAFSISWKGLSAECFPTFNLIPVCLSSY